MKKKMRVESRRAVAGRWLNAAGMRVEAFLFGLHRRTVRTGDAMLSVYDSCRRGRATLVMIHGFTGHKHVWARFARRFAMDYRVLIPDLPGHGDTAFSTHQGYGVEAQARRILSLLDALGIERAHLIGNSMGGFVATWLAMHHPARVESLVLFDPDGLASAPVSRLEKLADSGENPFLISSRRDFNRFYADIMSRPPYVPGWVREHMATQYQQQRDRIAGMYGDYAASERLTPHASALPSRVLIVWGREDRIIGVEAASAWHQAVPHADVEIWDGVGHMPMLERPRRAARRVYQFLQVPRSVLSSHTTLTSST
ncbi:pimeloyl-ACP methyl ester carboxylesterase [Luteibacter sp. Sphag1AF]|uniref:alpha/beta fold hydrolase n=1 Tax=Luteibacter sp. Sphag1AF TaxID=2587031 RepID=UPI00160BCE0A|nr:alpha/beta fold hydrolase [Luteibacter sp. Sphag1AF]MBB3228881.1 pimeloyl-ACP methyl ester carboxylesterase [Luteibacter sp. Sphag1AF]